jgi:hypothetical protein
LKYAFRFQIGLKLAEKQSLRTITNFINMVKSK